MHYWDGQRISRRRVLRGGASFGAGLAALSVVGCGDDNAGGPASGSQTSLGEALDWTKGKPGGTLNVGTNNYPDNLDLDTAGGGRVFGFSHDGLLQFKAGKSGVDFHSLDVEPNLAQAMPEQPNDLTYIFKIKPGVKFHNGRTLTVEDVKYSLERYASEKSALKDFYSWFDKIEITDSQTVTIKSKAPYADTLLSLAAYSHPYMMAKEHQESPAASERLMGTGPFIFVSAVPPVTVSFRRNPEYHLKPLPYFDDLKFLVITDIAKQTADFISRQVHFPWRYQPEGRDEIKKARADARFWSRERDGQCVIMRCDQSPFTDKRVRQGLGLSIDRKFLRDGVYHGEGEDDQVLSATSKYWGFRRPRELKSAKLWDYNPAEAKKLLAAAGIDKPIDKTNTIASGAANQFITDQGVLIQSRWKELGIANTTIKGVTSSQFANTVTLGNYDDMAMFQNSQQGILGIFHRSRWWSPPEGVKAPTNNSGHVNNAELSRLFDKQLTQFKLDERKATFHEIEEILGEEQYRLVLSTNFDAWFADPSLKNAEVFAYANNSSAWFVKYWWFDQA